MKRLILKSKDEPVEIHIVGESAITHASYMLDCGISNHFFGVCLDDVPSWNQHLITPAFMEHTYVDGKEIQLGHQVEIEIARVNSVFV